MTNVMTMTQLKEKTAKGSRQQHTNGSSKTKENVSRIAEDDMCQTEVDTCELLTMYRSELDAEMKSNVAKEIKIEGYEKVLNELKKQNKDKTEKIHVYEQELDRKNRGGLKKRLVAFKQEMHQAVSEDYIKQQREIVAAWVESEINSFK